MKKKIVVALLAGAIIGATGASALWMYVWGINPLGSDKTRSGPSTNGRKEASGSTRPSRTSFAISAASTWKT